jgi:hypothetical protein
VVIKKSSDEKNWGGEFRDANIPGYEPGSRGIELAVAE